MKRDRARSPTNDGAGRPEEFVTYIQLFIYAKQSWNSDACLSRDAGSAPTSGARPDPQLLHGLEAQAAACIEHNTLDVLPSIRCPCLVIGGRNDIFTPPWMAEEIAARIPACGIHIHENAGTPSTGSD